MNTTIYIFNENGIIKESELISFSNEINSQLLKRFDLKIKYSNSSESSIFLSYSSKDIEFTIYKFGYVMKLEGSISTILEFIFSIDLIIPSNVEYYISPSQRVENNEQFLFRRGSSISDTAFWLDTIFNNKDYTNSLSPF